MILTNDHVKRIVVFAPNKKFFGANILQIPFFQHIRKAYSNARITIWSPVEASKMIIDLNLADELLIYNGFKDHFRIFMNLLKLKPDIVFNLRWFSEGMNLLTGLSGAKLRVGFSSSSPFRFLLNGKVRRNDATYMGLLYLDLLKPTGIHPLFFFEDIRKMDASSRLVLPQNDQIVCLMPGGGEGEHKRWGIDHFCRLGVLILKKFPRAFLTFILGPNEKDYEKIITQYFNQSNCMTLLNGSLADIVKVSKLAQVSIANDCGPSHLAQMCGVNYIGLWGWKNQHPLQRIINWTIAKPNSIHLVAEQGMDIKNIEPESVFNAAIGFLMGE